MDLGEEERRHEAARVRHERHVGVREAHYLVHLLVLDDAKPPCTIAMGRSG
jgi:hypothetical protein